MLARKQAEFILGSSKTTEGKILRKDTEGFYNSADVLQFYETNSFLSLTDRVKEHIMVSNNQ